MKKYVLLGGLIAAAPMMILLVAGLLTKDSINTLVPMLMFPFGLPFYFILVPLGIAGALPDLGNIGRGDVFGYVPITDAVIITFLYFVIGMAIGAFIYKRKHRVLPKM